MSIAEAIAASVAALAMAMAVIFKVRADRKADSDRPKPRLTEHPAIHYPGDQMLKAKLEADFATRTAESNARLRAFVEEHTGMLATKTELQDLRSHMDDRLDVVRGDIKEIRGELRGLRKELT